MVITRAGAITAAAKEVSMSRENEKMRKSAARKCECRKRQSEEQQSEIWRTNWTRHAEGRACLSEERRSEIWQTNRMGHAEGHTSLSEERRSELWQTDQTWHAEGRECLSVSAERQSELRQTNRTGHAEGRARLSEEQHAENGAHHLNLLMLNHLSSNFVFVITYHTARQIIERPCHLLSDAVHNSKLTTLPQSQRRCQPQSSWQRILDARRIIERLAKDPVTLFHNMT
jgi:hypothetical protein